MSGNARADASCFFNDLFLAAVAENFIKRLRVTFGNFGSSVMERTLGLRLLPFTLSTGDVYTLKIKKIGYKDNYLPSVFDLEGDAWKPGEDTSLFPPTKFVCTYNTQSHRGQVKGELSARHPE